MVHLFGEKTTELLLIEVKRTLVVRYEHGVIYYEGPERRLQNQREIPKLCKNHYANAMRDRTGTAVTVEFVIGITSELNTLVPSQFK